MTLLHIVPRLPPLIDGIGDYAATLGMELRGRYGIESAFVSGDSLSRRFSETFQENKYDHVLLHYSGYGFHRRGIPNWLVSGLGELKTDLQTSLSIFFHEIWASGFPWQSAFYLQPIQRRIVRQLSMMARVCFTSTPKMQRLIRSGHHVILSPIPSSVPCVPTFREKAKTGPLQVVIFGQEHTRERSVGVHRSLLQGLVERSQLERLVLVGKGAGPKTPDFRAAASFLSPNLIQNAADASNSRIASIIADSDLFLSFYPSDLITKSTTIMAAFACGCPVVLRARSGPPDDEFSPAPPLIICDGSPKDVERLIHLRTEGKLNQTAAAALDWHQRHASWDVVSERVARGLGLESQFAEVPE